MTNPSWWEFADDPIRSDFRNFLYMVWEHLALPQPTPAQYEMAYFLQWGFAGYGQLEDGRCLKLNDAEGFWLLNPTCAVPWRQMAPKIDAREDILEAFRGIGKSYVAAAWALWLLLRDPVNEKVMVISASGSKAGEFVSFTKAILMGMDMLAHMRPRDDQRDTAKAFDVNGSNTAQSHSLAAKSVTGQITGSRATTIIADDIEVKDNSRTEDARKLLLQTVREFDNIKVPGQTRVIMLGTPQTEESVYNSCIKEMGYSCFCYPARYPMLDKRGSYQLRTKDNKVVDILAPSLRVIDRRPELAWKPTDTRFPETTLVNREAKGRSNFMLQFMLDTALADAERYPLKLFDLIVCSTHAMKAPSIVQWGRDSDKKNVRSDIPNLGFSGDYYLGPLFTDTEWLPYESKVLCVDPSGRGGDETGWAIVGALAGTLWALKVDGLATDMNESMHRIAMDARLYKVDKIIVEPNYGGQMWIAAFLPILAKVWPDRRDHGEGACTVVEGEWAKTQKEVRIIEILEPVLNTHRLVVDESLARDETLMYQLTRITKDRNCLEHDDRLDALANAVAFYTRAMALNANDAAAEARADLLDQEIADMLAVMTGEVGEGRVMRGRRRGSPDAHKYLEVHRSG